MKGFNLLAILLFVLFLSTGAYAGPYVVDGSVVDWGVDLTSAVNDGYLDAHTPTSPTADFFTEDNADTSNGSINVGPGYSTGNSYDAEAIYFDNDETNGYIAIISGLDFDDTFGPGDIGIDIGVGTASLTDDDSSVISTTPYEYGIKITAQNAAELWLVTKWDSVKYDGTPDPNYGQYSNPWRILEGTKLADVPFVYTNEVANGHYVIETSFGLSDLGLLTDDILNLHWTMQCGNDFVNLEANVDPVPEPTTILLSGIGLLGMGAYLRRRTRKS